MKKIIFILSVAIIAASCKKDSLEGYENQITGDWEYSNYIGYGIPQPLPPGNGRILVFGDGRSYERRSHDTVLFRGGYSLSRRKDCYGDEKYVFINTSDQSFTNDFKIERKGDSIFISNSNCHADGGTSIYRKL